MLLWTRMDCAGLDNVAQTHIPVKIEIGRVAALIEGRPRPAPL